MKCTPLVSLQLTKTSVIKEILQCILEIAKCFQRKAFKVQ